MTTDERYLVISADMHAGADLLGYRPYLPKRWLGEFDAWASAITSRWKESAALETTDSQDCRWDSDLRLAQLEADGIAAELIFPDTLPPFFPSSAIFANQPRDRADYERRFAGIQAHNRWMVDFCAAVPGRRKSPVQVFLYDIDDALNEIKWGYDAGMPAVLVPAVAPNHPLEGLWSKRYDPIWELCQELGMPVNQHVGAGTPDVGTDPAEGAALLYEVFWYARRSLWHMIFGGVFERYPNLKFVMTEEGLAWAVTEMARLDHYYSNVINHPKLAQSQFGYPALSKLSMPPSGYFQRNCYIGASSLPPSEVAARHMPGTNRVMWGADYPHPEGTYPFTTAALRATFSAVPQDECRAIFAGNAADVYGFDLELLRPIADRIGPRVSEIHTPLDVYPDDSLLSIYMGALAPERGAINGFAGQVEAV